MNRKDRIVYKELNESSAVQKSQGEQNCDSRIFLCGKFHLGSDVEDHVCRLALYVRVAAKIWKSSVLKYYT